MMVRPQAYFLPPIIVPNCLALQDNRSLTKMIEDACAIIVQAAAFGAAKILHKEESSVSSCAGRIAVVCVRRSVHDVYRCLGSSYFQRAYHMSYEKFWNLHSKLATRINCARLAMRRYVPKGRQKGGKCKLPPI